MLEVIVIFVLGLVWILFASVQDLKIREVPNWLSFSLVIFALGFRFFYGFFNESVGLSFFYQGLAGLFIFFIVGYLLYYSRMFAGGDAKLMIALGSILAFSTSFSINIQIFILFIFLFLLSGAVYGGIFTLALSFRNFKEFKRAFSVKLKENRKFVFAISFIGVLLIFFTFFESLFLSLGILVLIFPYFYLYAKTVDNVCMVKKMKTSYITEGEWLYQPIKVGKKIIKPSWDGLSTEDIKLIRKKYKEIKVKQGIAFIPVFLIAFLALGYLWFSGNWSLIV